MRRTTDRRDRPRHPARWAWLLAPFVGIPLACSSPAASDTAATATPGASIGTATTAVASTPSTAAAGVVTEVSADVADLWWHLGIATPTEAATADASLLDQEGIGECMRAAGFEYTPASSEPAAYDLHLGLSDEEYAARYGFGFAAYPLGEMPGQNTGSDNSGGSANEPYLDTLTPAQRTAFTSSYVSCRNQHRTKAYVDGYQTALDEYRSLIGSDQRVVDATTAWSECMAQAGFQYDAPQRMRDDLSYQVSQTADRATLRSIMKTEVAVAVANVTCEPPYLDVYRTVAAERIAELQTFVAALPATASGPMG